MQKYLSRLSMVALIGLCVTGLNNPAQAAITPKPPTCTCTASLSYARPSLQWSGSTLTFIPAVNISISTRGSSQAPKMNINLHHEGLTNYSSKYVDVPDGVSFSGDRSVVQNLSCGSRYSFSGYQLPSVSLTGLSRTMVGHRQTLTGNVQMKAMVQGCGFDEVENRQFGFTLKEFGNLFLGGWRSVR